MKYFLEKHKHIIPFGIIVIFSFIISLPFILHPEIIFGKRNDLGEFFIPLIQYSKLHILNNHLFPLWNNSILSGTPLVGNPQSPLFYFPNIIFLFTEIQSGYLILFIFHILIGAIGIYLCGRYLFNRSEISSLLIALLYFFLIRNPFYLEAGHVGIVFTTAYLPYIFFSYKKILSAKNFIWPLLLAISLTAVCNLHTITFILAVICLIIIFLVDLVVFSKIKLLKSILPRLLFSVIIFFGLSAIFLLPQLYWFGETTRKLISITKETFPIWLSKKEFFISLFIPWLKGPPNIIRLDTEKLISIGIIPTILALHGFCLLNKKNKLLTATAFVFICLFALNNLTSFGRIITSQNLLLYLRVTTRIWFVNSFIITFLAIKSLDYLLIKNKKFKILIAMIFALALLEQSFIAYSQFRRPQSFAYIPNKLIEIIKRDKDLFRIFCLDRCIPQKLAVENNLQLVEGYDTVQQYNYYKEFWQFTNSHWDYYTLSLPPMGLFIFSKIVPDAKSLGEFNTKYIISPYQLTNKNLKFIEKDNYYFLYLNKLFLPRSYILKNNQYYEISDIASYSPNQIRVILNEYISPYLILSEVYSPGWNAYLNGHEKILVQQRPNVLRSVDINKETKFVDFRYEPEGFKKGAYISLITFSSLIIILLTLNLSQNRKLHKK